MNSRKMLCLISASALSWVSSAHAQETSANESSNDQASGGTATSVATEAEDTEVVVTAERLSDLTVRSSAAGRIPLTSLETPASVAVLSGEAIREWGYDTINEAHTRAPGISAAPHNGNGNSALSTRGFYGASAIAQLYDGVQLINAGSVNGFPFDPWNVERIEILYGPASVLYGAGAVGGALNVIGKKPDPEAFLNQGRLSYGSFNTVRAALDSTGPLNSWLSYRVTASYMTSDHWVENADASSLALSAALRADIDDTLSISFFQDFGDQRPSTYEGTPTLQGEILPELRYKNYNFEDARVQFREHRSRLNASWAPSDNLTVVADGYYADFSRQYRYMYNFTYLPATQQVRRTTFREIDSPQYQAGGTVHGLWKADLGGDARNEFVAGGSYGHSLYKRSDNTVAGYNGGLSIVDALSFEQGSFFDSGAPRSRPQYDVTIEQTGLFLQDRMILSDSLSLVSGFRWDRYSILHDEYATDVQTSGEMEGTSYNFGVVFQPMSGTSLYAQYARGVDPVTSLGSASPSNFVFDLSPGRQIEAGIKQVLWNGKLEWTLAAYQIVKKGLLTPSAAAGGATEQVGQQSSRGIEASFALKATDTLLIEANGTILDAKFDDFFSGSGNNLVSLEGNVPQWVPESTANLRVKWDFLPDW
ncbi:MAG: TonB-dependent receptor, partial [Oxalobacteraceae bacterium]